MHAHRKKMLSGLFVALSGTLIVAVGHAQPAPDTVQTVFAGRGGCAGGLFGCATDTPYGGRCDAGFHRKDCIVTRTRGNGNCFAGRRNDRTPWLSNDPSDCRCYMHAGAAATQGVDCAVSITEEGTPTIYVTTTLLDYDFKRWNQNPVGPGCKNDSYLPFTIPQGATLASITVGDHSCSATGLDVQAGRENDTHRGLFNPVVGGMRINRRPPSGAGPGRYQVYFHWWFNQWGSSEFHMCINITHKRSTQINTETVAGHLNMDDGLKAYPVKTPICIKSIGVTVNVPLPGSEDPTTVRPDVTTAACNNGELWWFGCKDDHGRVVTW